MLLPNPWGKQISQLDLVAYVIRWGCRRVTFICGRAGVCALGAVAAKHAGDGRLLDHYLAQFKEVPVAFLPLLCIFFPSKVGCFYIS